ncbi:hypothetical protein [Jiangella sp. DSM 45060]|uniref:hypothetical protein n=1 Tax=Jiangella sp. DSM 45060 TaxID=1798224 RepID=UPI00087AD21C|nr:hypothetical protein [Jiangella sp. DSM 45060]SDT34413.1 hypothetical protein SAMN04515669_3639 [Jiangella sp. DSM 45060]
MPLLPSLAVAALLLGAPADGAAEPPAGTVDAMIEQLRDDPILVQPSMAMGDSGLAHDLLTEAAADAGVPVYVVLADTPTDLAGTDSMSEQAAALFRAELGDGLYHVEFRDGISYTRSWGGGELDDAYLAPVTYAIERAESNAAGEYPRASALLEAVLTVRWAAAPLDELPDSVVDDYAAQPWAFVAETDYDRADSAAARWVALLATTFGLLVAGAIITPVVLRAKPATGRGGATGRRRGSASVSVPARRVGPTRAGRGLPTTSAVPDDIAATATRQLDDARRRLAGLSPEQLTSPAGTAAADALEAGDLVLATGDPLDAVGATVLAAVAVRETERATSPKREPYRPCFVNPLHGEARNTVRIDGSSIDAPVCRDCNRDQDRFLAVRRRLRGSMPYVETSTVWARTGFGALVGDLAAQVLDDRSARR